MNPALLKGRKLCELWYLPYDGNAGFISSTVWRDLLPHVPVSRTLQDDMLQHAISTFAPGVPLRPLWSSAQPSVLWSWEPNSIIRVYVWTLSGEGTGSQGFAPISTPSPDQSPAQPSPDQPSPELKVRL